MSQTPVMRILDASLNRASEGLRVMEDFVRFGLDDLFLTNQTKLLRHDLARFAEMIPSADRHASRNTQADVGTRVTTDAELERGDLWAVSAASMKRAEQAIRSLEEYGKLVSNEFAGNMESLRYRLYTLEKAIDVGRSSRERLEGMQLCVLTDGRQSPAEFEQLISILVDVGVGIIQLRDKGLDDRGLAERARQLRRLTRGTTTLCIVNDRADIAAIVGADGVHIGQEDLSVKDARAVVGQRMLIGVSTHNLEQARTAVLDGANYLGAGPTFSSHTKTFDAFAGTEYLRQVAGEVRLPTFAIGGIARDNLDDVFVCGIERVAVSSAVIDSANPAAAARELVGRLHSNLAARTSHRTSERSSDRPAHSI
jgi:thiamine-phosphate pyrophosphorylase